MGPTIIEVTGPQSFHPLPTLTQAEEESGATRTFYGDGGPYLLVPGLISLATVRMGSVTFPEHRIDQVIVDQNENRAWLRLPMIALDRGPDGTPVLRRSMVSNDGNWQKDEAFLVSGEWDPAVPPPPPRGERKAQLTTFSQEVPAASPPPPAPEPPPVPEPAASGGKAKG